MKRFRVVIEGEAENERLIENMTWRIQNMVRMSPGVYVRETKIQPIEGPRERK